MMSGYNTNYINLHSSIFHNLIIQIWPIVIKVVLVRLILKIYIQDDIFKYIPHVGEMLPITLILRDFTFE